MSASTPTPTPTPASALLAVVEATRPFWDVFCDQPAFHHLVTLVTSQRVRFQVGRAFRQWLYKCIAPDVHFTPINLGRALGLCKDAAYVASNPMPNLPSSQLQTLERIAEAFASDASDTAVWAALPSLRGVGPWTREGLAIMLNMPGSENLYLKEDKWVTARACELNISPEHAMYDGHRRDLTMFLWRLKPCAGKTEFTRDCFL